MSQEIINVLNYLGEQLGIAIDWSAENVWPQVMDILGRYRLMEIISIGAWMLVEVGFAIFAITVVVKMAKALSLYHKDKERNFWFFSYYGSPCLTGFGMTLVIVAGLVGLISIISFPIDVENLLKWVIVPEIKYLEMLKGLMT